MRYSRNIKIFRGGVDAAPFASLFFLVVMFVMLFYSHIFFPGVPIKLADEEPPPEIESRTVTVHSSGNIYFLGSSYDLASLKSEIQSRSQKGTLPHRVIFESDPSANRKTVLQVENLLKSAGIALKLPGSRLELADFAGFAGAHNPVVVVGINLNGQLFFQHQLVTERVLEERLATTVERANEPITLLLQADKNVPTERITRMAQIALRAGINDVYIGTKPAGT